LAPTWIASFVELMYGGASGSFYRLRWLRSRSGGRCGGRRRRWRAMRRVQEWVQEGRNRLGYAVLARSATSHGR